MKTENKMGITLKRVNRALPEYDKVKNLYFTAFPDDERSPFILNEILSHGRTADFWSVYRNGGWIGFAYVISNESLAYLFYLAIDSAKRGSSNGSRTLRALKKLYAGQKFFLALEKLDENAENYADRVRRRHFYEKNGFSLLNCELKEKKVTYDVMGIGGEVTPQEYQKLVDSYMGRLLYRLFPMEIAAKNTDDTGEKNEAGTEN
ncbi:MAG: GNAT family N-acetyltransferase [Huintestinicola sp.]